MSTDDPFTRGYESARTYYDGKPRSALLRIERAFTTLEGTVAAPKAIPPGHPLRAFLAEVEESLKLGGVR